MPPFVPAVARAAKLGGRADGGVFCKNNQLTGEALKILFYNHTGQVSGAERILLMILAKLNQRMFQASVICPQNGDLAHLVRETGTPVTSAELLEARFTWRPDRLIKYLKSFFQVIFNLRRKIIESNPDLIHANSIRAGLVATTATLGTNIRVVWHLHDILPHHPLSTLIRWYAFLSARTRPLAVSHAVANGFCGRLLGYFSVGRMVNVIHNGVDLSRFKPNWPEKERVRQELTQGEDKLLIGIIGQITPRKGHLELIRALAKTTLQLPQAILVIVGAPLFNDDHQYLFELKQTARSLGIGDRVIFTGARADVPAIMQALDLLVMNSKAEPFAVVLLEAVASGTPVLATAVDGVLELIDHKVNGWLVPAENEGKLVEALVTLGRDSKLRASLGENARKYSSPKYSAEKYLGLLEDFYLQSAATTKEEFEHRVISPVE